MTTAVLRRQRRAVKRLLARSCSTSSTSSHTDSNTSSHAHSPDPEAEGVNPFRANAVDFHLTPQDALHEFKKWNDHVFAPTPLDALLDREKQPDDGGDDGEIDASTSSSGRRRGFFTRLVQKHSSLTVHAVFVPFWVFDAVARVRFSARLGFSHNTLEFVHQSNEYIPAKKTRWRVHRAEQVVKHDATERGMQVYAASKYPKFYVDCLRGPHVEHCAEFDGARHLAPHASTDTHRDVDAFTMRHTHAWEQSALEYFEKVERRRLEKTLTQQYEADRCEITTMDFEFLSRKVRSVYLPAYIVEYTANNRSLFAFINGASDGKVSGVPQYSSLKVGFTSLIALNALYSTMHFLSLLPLDSLFYTLFTAPPALAAAYVARTFPLRRLRVIERLHQRELDAVEGAFTGDSTWTSDGEYYSEGFFHHQQRVKDGTAQSKSASGAASGGGWFGGGDADTTTNPDPKGYYKTLGLSGLEQSSTNVDVRSAFRRQAMRWHPDHLPQDATDAQIEESNVRFKEVMQAYRVLRNDKKRRTYDDLARKASAEAAS